MGWMTNTWRRKEIPMNNTVTLEQVAALAAQLPPQDRRKLAERLLADQSTPTVTRLRWADLKGLFPYPLCGEDAQAWVSRTRAEADVQRAQATRRKS
jgi:hypothetical protein